MPELAEWYLKYCIETCAWNTAMFKPKAEQQMQKALEKLVASPKWKTRLDEHDMALLSAQIK